MWMFAVVWALVAALTAAAVQSQAGRAALTQRFGRVVGLAVTPEVEPVVRQHVVRRTLGAAAGALLASGTLAGLAIGRVDLGRWLPLVAILVLYAGVAAGMTVAASTTPSRRLDDGMRVARASRPALGAYLAAFELWGTRIAVSLAVILTAVAAAIAPTSRQLPVWIAVAAVAAGTLVAWEVFGRRVIDRAVVSASTQELAWNDALRAGILRATITLPMTLGTVGVVLPLLELLFTAMPGREGAVLGAGVLLVILAALVVVVVLSIAAKPARHYQRELWPSLVAGDLR